MGPHCRIEFHIVPTLVLVVLQQSSSFQYLHVVAPEFVHRRAIHGKQGHGLTATERAALVVTQIPFRGQRYVLRRGRLVLGDPASVPRLDPKHHAVVVRGLLGTLSQLLPLCQPVAVGTIPTNGIDDVGIGTGILPATQSRHGEARGSGCQQCRTDVAPLVEHWPSSGCAPTPSWPPPPRMRMPLGQPQWSGMRMTMGARSGMR